MSAGKLNNNQFEFASMRLILWIEAVTAVQKLNYFFLV